MSMTVTPATATLAPGDAAVVVVVLSNAGSRPVTVRSIEVFAPPRVELEREDGEDAAAVTVRPGQRDTVRYTLTAQRDAADGDVTFMGDLGHRYLVATATVTVQAPEVALAVSIASVPSSLTDGQKAEVGLLVENTSSYPILDVRLRPISSMDVVVGGSDTGCPAGGGGGSADDAVACIEALEAGESRVVELELRVDERVNAGRQAVGVVVSGGVDAPAARFSTTSSATTEVEIEVFGVKAIGALGTAPLFVVPGFLAILLFIALGRFAYPRTSWLPNKVDVTDSKVVVAALPISVGIYALVWWVWGTDLTKELGSFDVLKLMGLGVVLGTGVWAVFALAYLRMIGRLQFKVGDPPAKVLERLAWAHAALQRPTVGGAPAIRLLGPGPGGTVATSSALRFTFREGLSDQARSDFRTAVDTSDIDEILDGLGDGMVTLTWAGTPVRLQDEASALPAAPQPLLEEQT